MQYIIFAALIILAYLIGSIPFGLVYARLRGVDIRKVGSGNIGATNVSRQFGFLGGFVPVFLLDFLKGALPVILVRVLNVTIISQDISMIIVGMAAIVGHIFPIYLGFKGGKGVATATGTFILILPLEASICLAVFVVVLFLVRIIDLLFSQEKVTFKAIFKGLSKRLWVASITAAICLPIVSFILEFDRTPILVITILLAIMITASHHKNIREALSSNKK